QQSAGALLRAKRPTIPVATVLLSAVFYPLCLICVHPRSSVAMTVVSSLRQSCGSSPAIEFVRKVNQQAKRRDDCRLNRLDESAVRQQPRSENQRGHGDDGPAG